MGQERTLEKEVQKFATYINDVDLGMVGKLPEHHSLTTTELKMIEHGNYECLWISRAGYGNKICVDYNLKPAELENKLEKYLINK